MLAEITLPSFLTEKLAHAPHRHVVHKALENFSDWFRSSRLPFFPDYTDHGIQHIEQVLATAANLIPDQARQYFSGADAAALILAVLLHDSALHLTDASVWQLIKGPAAPYSPVKPFDQKGWAQTWDDFMFLARRWDDTKLAQVFGSAEPGGLPTASVRDPFAHWQNLTRTDNLLIGEFIRQKHPRLAHEMALYGVPGTTGALLKLDDSLPAEWRDLVGLIARSHGLPLRTCLDYLKNSHDFGEPARREYQGVHAVYLMALLRVADYIQIQGDRTSNRIFNYRKIYSSVSTIEHKVHQSVRNITNKVDDPEALFIQARPEEVSVFLRLKEWLAGIQQELDGSWAVLGEVYGRDEELRNLGLTFRRVRSNLDDVAEFAKTVPYVPDRIRFDVARSELLKLLIGPLYGDDPSYGVRELMQNAIDAVREYDQFVLDNPQYKDVPRREQEADVVVELGPFDEAKGYAVMTISDRGIGMTEATIRDYFLRAGASYRQNADWKTAFETTDGLSSKSKVLRSGRFGVGALAAFLIGERIEVESRHIADVKGYLFKTNLDLESINVTHAEYAIGTCIRIPVSKLVYDSLLKIHSKTNMPNRFNWYHLNYPLVLRRWYSIKGKVNSDGNYQGLNPEAGGKWRKLILDYPYQVYWTLSGAPMLSCNGIFISDKSDLGHVPPVVAKRIFKQNSPVEYPRLSIMDPSAKFPLNLQRNDIRIDSYEFGSELLHDVLQEMLAWLLFNGFDKLNSQAIAKASLPWLSFYVRNDAVIACKKGFGIMMATLLDGIPIRHAIGFRRKGINLEITSEDCFIFNTSVPWNKRYGDDRLLKLVVVKGSNGTEWVNSVHRTVFYYHHYSDKSAPRGKGRITLSNNGIKLNLEQQKKGWLTVSQSGCPHAEFNIIDRPVVVGLDSVYERNSKMEYLTEHFFPEDSYLRALSPPWLLDELWLEHFGREWIPFDLKERIAKFPKAAQFFKEHYPQVVPDEAWALLGGKPATM